MTKYFLFTVSIIFSIAGYSQNPVIINQPYDFQKWIKVKDSLHAARIIPDSTLQLPPGCGTPSGTASLKGGDRKRPALFYDTCGAILYVYNPKDSTWATSGNHITLETYYGTIYQKSSWSNLNDFTINGATASISGDSILLSGGANDFSKTIDLNYATLLNRWKCVTAFRVGDTSATSYGIGVGLNGINGWSGHQHDIVGKINLANGFLTLENNGGAGTYTTVATSSSNLTFAEGDMLRLTVERVLDSVFATVRNLTNPNVISCKYQWLTTTSAIPIPNTGKFSVYSFGGTQIIDSIAITSKGIKNADIFIAGDSKSVYYANQYSRLYGQRLAQYYSVELNAGPGDRTPELIARLQEIKALSPKQVLIQEFSNDLRSGMTFSQSIANINAITDSLTKWGIDYYFIPFYETSLDLIQWNNYFLANYPTHYINTWGLFQSGFLQDGIHPTDAGQDTLTKIILNSFKLKGGNNRLDLFAGKIGGNVINATPGSVIFIDSKASLAENNSQLYWDNTLNRLGIGTNAPTSPLNVVGGITADTVYGGSTTSDSLRLMSTSHITKGKILFGTSAYNESNDRLGIGTRNPSAQIDIRTNSDAANGVEITNTSPTTSAGSRLLLWNETRTTIAQFLFCNSTSVFSPNGLIINTSAGKVSLASLSDDITFGKSTTINGSNEHARFKFNGNFLLGTTTDNSYKLQVNGAISTVTDSAGSPVNMAWIDTDGKIRKTAATSVNGATGAVSVTGGTAITTSTASGVITVAVDVNNSSLPHTVQTFFIDADNSGTSETDLYSSTIAANTLGSNGQTLYFDFTDSLKDVTATADIAIYFAGTQIGNTGALTVSATGAVRVTGSITRATSSTARATVAISSPGASTALYTNELDLSGLNFAGSNILKMTGQAGGAGGGSGDIRAKMGKILYQP
jgi:hypothetical protein